MISVDFFVLSSGEIVGFNISGHAGLAPAGQDILCAAVSSAAYMVLNTISDVIKANANITVNDLGAMSLKVSTKDYLACKDILLGFKLHLLALEEQYPEHIIVNYMEV